MVPSFYLQVLYFRHFLLVPPICHFSFSFFTQQILSRVRPFLSPRRASSRVKLPSSVALHHADKLPPPIFDSSPFIYISQSSFRSILFDFSHKQSSLSLSFPLLCLHFQWVLIPFGCAITRPSGSPSYSSTFRLRFSP
ncbi:hypothetical protein I3760_08G027100 [Carya illinoinensis]|nr:hypothetical protein I3760_08G027100 [Carya illinoinensis]